MSQSDWLEVHVFGTATRGESIVCKLPDGSYCVIDCCGRNPDNTNPVCEFLSGRGVTQLSFVALTHPHADHFVGLADVISRFPPTYFVESAAMNKRRLKLLFQRNFNQLDPNREFERKELLSLLTALKGLNKPPMRASCRSEVLISTKPNFSVKCFAPSTQSIEQYEEALLNGKPDPNMISLGLSIVWDDRCVLLGGDVLNADWTAAIADVPTYFGKCAVVKLSHHGSIGANNPQNIQILAANNRSKKIPHGVVTAYSSSGLPDVSFMRSLRDHVSKICTPRVRKSGVPAKIPPLSAKPGAAVAKRFNASLPSTGRCSYLISNSGMVKENHQKGFGQLV